MDAYHYILRRLLTRVISLHPLQEWVFDRRIQVLKAIGFLLYGCLEKKREVCVSPFSISYLDTLCSNKNSAPVLNALLSAHIEPRDYFSMPTLFWMHVLPTCAAVP